MISNEDVLKLADLAHISVAPADAATMAKEMDAILAYVDDVSKLSANAATERKKPALYNVVREDVVTNTPGQYTDAIVAQFPDRDGNALRVRKIL